MIYTYIWYYFFVIKNDITINHHIVVSDIASEYYFYIVRNSGCESRGLYIGPKTLFSPHVIPIVSEFWSLLCSTNSEIFCRLCSDEEHDHEHEHAWNTRLCTAHVWTHPHVQYISMNMNMHMKWTWTCTKYLNKYMFI